MSAVDRRSVRAAAVKRLSTAGVSSPAYDADELLAHVLDTDRGRLPGVDVLTVDQARAYEALVVRREQREPLQHLTGTAAFRYLTLEVGPGVFVPRPETELLAGWAVDVAREMGAGAVVVDLCTGSGAIAKAVATEVPEATVHAVEIDEGAHAWAVRNLAGTAVDLRLGDLATELDELVGEVDIITCNPPYVPLTAWESVAAEARDHDPHLALFSGDDGLDTIRVLERRAARLLRPGGSVGFEHADVQGRSAPAIFTDTGRWREVRDHLDLAGRPRYTTARLAR